MTDSIQPPEDDQTTVPQHITVTVGLTKPIRTWSPSKKKYYDKTTRVVGFVYDNLSKDENVHGAVVMEVIRNYCRDMIAANRKGISTYRYIMVKFDAPHSVTYQWSPKKGWSKKGWSQKDNDRKDNV